MNSTISPKSSSTRINLQRRAFLQHSLRNLAGFSLASALGLIGCSNNAVVPRPSAPIPLPWDALASALQGRLLRPGQPNFDSASAPWNLRYAGLKPAAVARCLSVEDVRASLLWATNHGVPLVARSGGHSYAGYSLTKGLMIDVSQMRALSLDANTGLVKVAGGARNATVYEALRAPSLAVTHGRCRQVGVAGLALGGGIGFNMRARGLTCDQLVETEIVLASGDILTCNETQNSDLFWACRGAGGGNFGIHTAFTFQTFPVSTVTVYRLAWQAKTREVLEKLIDVLLTAPDKLGCKVSVDARPGKPLEVVLLGQLVGTPDELNAILAEVTTQFSPISSDIKTVSYWDGQEYLSEDGDPEYSHERSRYVFGNLSAAALDAIFDHMGRWPGTSVGATWKFFLMGGAVAARADDATAYNHRKATMLSSIDLEWSPADSPGLMLKNQAWLSGFHEAMRPHTSEQSYQNFIDDSQRDFLRSYYGDNLERLVQIKRHYDPTNVFCYRQSIPTAL